MTIFATKNHMSKTENSQIIIWLKRIFSWQTIIAIITICGFVFSYMQFRHDIGGTLSAFYNGEIAYNDDKQNVVVCVNSPNVVLPVASFAPIFVNNSEYSIRDFMLQYQIEAEDIDVEFSEYFFLYKTNRSKTLRYKENVLYSHSEIEYPILSLNNIQNNSTFKTHVKATYDGAERPFNYIVNADFYVVPQPKNMAFGEWKSQCENSVLPKVTANKFNVLYVTDKDYDQELIVPSLRQITSESSFAKPSIPQPSSSQIVDTFQKKTQPTKIDNTPIPVYQDASNEDINIIKCDIARLADSTLVATLYFDKLLKDTDVCFAFNYNYDNSINISHGGRYKSLKCGMTQTSMTFYKKCNNLTFVGIAVEDPELATYITQPAPYRFKNNADFPICIYMEYGTSYSYSLTTFAVSANSSISFGISDKSNPIKLMKYFRVPVVDTRTNKWQRFKYNVDGTETGGYLMFFLGIFFFIVYIVIFLIICYEERETPLVLLKKMVKDIKEKMSGWHKFMDDDVWSYYFYLLIIIVPLIFSIYKFIIA